MAQEVNDSANENTEMLLAVCFYHGDAVYMLSSCIRPSVYLSQIEVIPTARCRITETTPQQVKVTFLRSHVVADHSSCPGRQSVRFPSPGSDSCFLMRKILAKFRQGHPQRGRQIQMYWVKIGGFRPISCYISETVQETMES